MAISWSLDQALIWIATGSTDQTDEASIHPWIAYVRSDADWARQNLRNQPASAVDQLLDAIRTEVVNAYSNGKRLTDLDWFLGARVEYDAAHNAYLANGNGSSPAKLSPYFDAKNLMETFGHASNGQGFSAWSRSLLNSIMPRNLSLSFGASQSGTSASSRPDSPTPAASERSPIELRHEEAVPSGSTANERLKKAEQLPVEGANAGGSPKPISAMRLSVTEVMPAMDACPTREVSYRTGAAGRPTSMHLILGEARRRLQAGPPPLNQKTFAVELSKWLNACHSDAAPARAKTIVNNPEFRALYQAHKSVPKFDPKIIG